MAANVYVVKVTSRNVRTGSITKFAIAALSHLLRRIKVHPRFATAAAYDDSITDLSVEGNLESWRLLEQAKRRLMYGLDSLGLPHGTIADGFVSGLSFDFKGDSIAPAEVYGAQSALKNGFLQVTLVEKLPSIFREADTVEREKLRIDLGEGQSNTHWSFSARNWSLLQGMFW